MRDQFIEIVHRRICSLPEDLAVKNPHAALIFITYQEAQMHPVLYAKHLALQFFRKSRR